MSSNHTNAAMPTTAGQWPSAFGYGIGAGRGLRLTADATPPAARAIARHGLKALKTSPNSMLAIGSPIQNHAKLKVGVMFVADSWDPAKPAYTMSTKSATPINPHSGSSRRGSEKNPALGRLLETRLGPEHRQADERHDEHDRRPPAEQPLRDREVLAADEPVGERGLRRQHQDADRRHEGGEQAAAIHWRQSRKPPSPPRRAAPAALVRCRPCEHRSTR